MNGTEGNQFLASQSDLLESLIRLCEAIWEKECMNRECEECWIGQKKKELKEYFYINS